MRIVQLIAGICLLAPGWAAAQVAAAPPDGPETRSVALILTDAAHEPAARDLAARLRGMHAATILLSAEDTARRAKACDGPGRDLAALAEGAGGARRIAPVLVGLGAGADLALAAAQDLPAAFKGLATLGYARGDCASAPGGKAAVRWHDVGPAPAAPDLRGVRHYPQGDAPQAALTKAYLALAGMDHAFAPSGADMDEFPITLHHDPDAPQTDVYAIFLSGDGGWANFDRQVAERLAARGTPVVGLSTLRYLWQERGPAEIARDMARIHAHFAPRLGRARVLLIGFSLGANVTPFYAPLLPPDMQARVAGLALLSPETATGFEIVIGGWLGRATGAADVGAAIRAAAGLRPLCLYGLDDGASACPAAAGGHVAVQGVAGGHHLGADYDRIAALILDLAAPALMLR